MVVNSADRSNAWQLLDVADAAATTSVSIVIPAHDCQDSLDRLLASIAAQRYRAEHIQVVVVDDGSTPPITVPNGVTCLRQESDGSFGAGRARNAGAAIATGDVLLFLDADLLLGPDAVGRLLRWYEASPASVVTGTINFFDLDDVGVDALVDAIESQSVPLLLAKVGSDDQVWREKTFRRTYDLTTDCSDLFRIMIGALMCVPRALHESIGGLRALGVRGIEDTEYGYRLHNAGGLFVLDRSVDVWHQGRRFFDSSAAKDAKRERTELIESLIPERTFRAVGRSDHRVPIAVVDIADGVVVSGLDGLGRADVCVLSGAPLDPERRRDLDASPIEIRVLHDCALGPGVVDELVERLMHEGIGVVRAVDGDGQEILTAYRRRAIGRAHITGGERDSQGRDRAGVVFGDWSLPGEMLGIRSELDGDVS